MPIDRSFEPTTKRFLLETMQQRSRKTFSRRDFFSRMGDGLHGAALASLLGSDLFSPAVQGESRHRTYDLKPQPPHFEPRAKSVIHLFMNGGPSQVDLFDPKPALQKYAGKPPPRDIVNQIEFANEIGGFLPSPYPFKHCGDCGMEISEVLPHLAKRADDITLVRSMYGEHFNHEPSLYLMHSGRTLPGRPSLGAWVTYGLGSENQNLPGYVVLDDPKSLPVNEIQSWAVRMAAGTLSGHAVPSRRSALAESQAQRRPAGPAGGSRARAASPAG